MPNSSVSIFGDTLNSKNNTQGQLLRIGCYTLNPNSGEISAERNADKSTKLRPKTLETLNYLLARRDQVVSKQSLLDAVWDDVVTQDYVVFQSINEIRKAFDGLDVIKTVPRKGYQWIAPTQQAEEFNQAIPKRVLLSGALLCMAIAFVVLFTLFKQDESIEQEFAEYFVLPIEVAQHDDVHMGVSYSGMDRIIHALADSDTHVTISSEIVLDTLQRVDKVKADANLNEFAESLRYAAGEITVVHTELLGTPMEYQLAYTIISSSHIERGVLEGESIDALSTALADAILGKSNTSSAQPYESAFSNEAFLRGMQRFYADEYADAEIFFKATLVNKNAQTPSSLMRYLAMSLQRQGKLAEAEASARAAIQATNNASEALRSQFVLGTILYNQGELNAAESTIEAARKAAEYWQDELYLAFSLEVLGMQAEQEQNWQIAEQHYREALAYHRRFGCPYGEFNNLVHLSSLASSQGRAQQSDNWLEDARQVALANGLKYGLEKIDSITRDGPQGPELSDL